MFATPTSASIGVLAVATRPTGARAPAPLDVVTP